ncbi:uncharacterized protein PV09_01796 [Verruconis gallopava]|uniref:NADH:ubiquinone oxidoreductase intermediate-associated protein 30 domain-containing protein n=1 Tax=Verruconis gallopava TaxID=253628 RepID=A0A0D2AMA3_9PEZI|nr:uncharacterized protein PV09_01796 [Verruconis gallopava]KIW07883.1 hypothetical protein PV09_01796 [Verruconis gallopava]
MQCTRRLLGPPGIFKRSLEDVKRFVGIATRLEAVTGPTRPYDLIFFKDKSSIEQCKTMSDADMGGFSTVHLDYIPAKDSEPAHARFHGTISTELPRNKPHIVRSGYAGWATQDRKPTLFGRGFWDFDPYTHLCLNVLSDGRKYFVNIRTDSIVASDVHQHQLTAKQPGKWETVVIDLKEFVRTNQGEVVEPQSEMLRESVKSVGISLLDRIPRPFELKISRVWIANLNGDVEFRHDQLHGSEDLENEKISPTTRRRRSNLPDKILM